tara:strand:+ start:923 stop:1729 length:807 start_codon:yes stop_codon:yes gene_type:complete
MIEEIDNNKPLTFIAGPCQIESLTHAEMVAGTLKEITDELGINFIYKSSFDKANRTSGHSKRGVGLTKGLDILCEIKAQGISVLTDVHETYQCNEVSQVVDIIQIPALLCRQTDLLTTAALLGKIINIKKGQFMAPLDMIHVVNKIKHINKNILITERGTTFGYNTLVSDFRAIPTMADTTGCPIIFDATHSVQQPGGQVTQSGGQRGFVPTLARAAVAVGVAGIFTEVHEDPDNAPSDGPCMLDLKDVRPFLKTLLKIDRVVKNKET